MLTMNYTKSDKETENTQLPKQTPASNVKIKIEPYPDRRKVQFIEKQIALFNEKIALCQASYSEAQASQMLNALQSAWKQPLTSVLKLRQCVLSMGKSQPQSPPVVYGEWFLNNIIYLKELKSVFDDKIYKQILTLRRSKQNGHLDSESLPLHSISNQNRPSTSESVLKFKHDVPEVKDLYDFEEMESILTHLEYIRRNWQKLLDDEEMINTTLFSAGRVTVGAKNAVNSESIISLVSDILFKCSDVASSAKLWLDTYSSKVLDLQTKYHKLERVRKVFTDRLGTLHKGIEEEEKVLEDRSTDLVYLVEREERSNEIISKSKNINSKILSLENKINELEQQLETLQRKKSKASQGSHHVQQITYEIDSLQIALLSLKKDKAVMEYQLDVLEEDLSLELELKPAIVRYTDQLQDSCEQMEKLLEQMRIEKQHLELALVPVLEDSRITREEITRSNSLV